MLQKRLDLKKRVVLCIVLLLTAILILGCTGKSSSGELNFINLDELVITGTGLKQEVILNKSDWMNFNHPKLIERFYSSNNRVGYHKIWKVKGFDLMELIGEDNFMREEDWSVTFIAQDGAKLTLKISDLKNSYYYPQFNVEEGIQMNPLIGIYQKTLFEPKYTGAPTEIEWEDLELTEADLDPQAPRLFLGQKAGDTSDVNQSLFIYQLARIVVGDERS